MASDWLGPKSSEKSSHPFPAVAKKFKTSGTSGKLLYILKLKYFKCSAWFDKTTSETDHRPQELKNEP